jgi:hypothetical protein
VRIIYPRRFWKNLSEAASLIASTAVCAEKEIEAHTRLWRRKKTFPKMGLISQKMHK